MNSNIYTDLAREAREIHPDLPGVTEEVETYGAASVSRIVVATAEAAGLLGKPAGRYITIDAPKLTLRDTAVFRAISAILSRELEPLLPAHCRGNEALGSVLVVGLGNRYITPDALGPIVVEKAFVTRHIAEHLPDIIGQAMRPVAAVAPGVLGTTGVETLEMLRGLVERVKPDVMIAIDALASRRAGRISTVIQLTDTGISPGSGVGNTGRMGLTEESLGVPVVAIGVPTVVLAGTILQDALSLAQAKAGVTAGGNIAELAAEVLQEEFGPMIVTPKDIDSIVRDMAGIVAEGINICLHRGYYDKLRELMA